MIANQIDGRTQSYLDTVKANIGYTGRNQSEEVDIFDICKLKGFAEPERLYAFSGYLNSSPIEVYKYVNSDGELRYCAQISYMVQDAYVIETLIFTKEPTYKNVLTARQIGSLVFDIEYQGAPQTFACRECGCHTHWLDTPGDLNDKIENLKNRYCGC